MPSILVQDRATYAISRRETTDQGYLKVPGRVARVGVQYYLARELGITDREPNDLIGVYRPAEEVFSPASLKSYADTDVTISHPGDMVSAKTFRQHSVGHVTDTAIQDGEFVEAPLIIKDAEAIDQVNSGLVELSAGYLAEYVPEKGVTESGEKYEYVQKNIRINHVALVPSARAGREARLFDQKPQEAKPMTVTVTLDGASIEVADKSTATLIEDRFNGLLKRANDADSKIKKLEAERDAAQARADAKEEEIEAERAKSSRDSMSKKISAILAARDGAAKLVGDEFTCDSMDETEIKRAAMAAVRPSRDWASASEAYVQAAYDEAMERKEEEKDEEDKRKKKTGDGLARFGQDMQGAKPDGQPTATIDSAYDAYMARKVAASQEAK